MLCDGSSAPHEQVQLSAATAACLQGIWKPRTSSGSGSAPCHSHHVVQWAPLPTQGYLHHLSLQTRMHLSRLILHQQTSPS